ncbi:antitoxin [Streptomyces sp. NPDC001020]
MSVMDKLRHLLKGHEDQESRGIDRSGDFVDDKTQGKYTDQVDQAQEVLKERLRSDQQDDPPQP